MLNKSQEIWKHNGRAKVWLMKKTAEKKLSYAEIDDKVVSLLMKKGIRITKSSAITPKGVFSIDDKDKKGWKGLVDKLKKRLIEKGVVKPKADNLFFEMDYNFSEVKAIYDKIGGFQNNFPPYIRTKKEFEEYKKTHDIFVFEDVKTNKPIGFMTMCIYKKGSQDFKEMEEDYGIKLKKDVLYYDTLAIDKSYQGSSVGRDVADVLNNFYSNVFGNSHEFLLVTGEINQNKDGQPSKGFHSKVLGFEIVGELEVDSSKYKNRYDHYKNKGYENLNLSLRNSYSRRA